MSQSSIYYAAGRISALGKDALDLAKLERLIQAQSLAEARRVLADTGWDGGDFENSAAEHMRKACGIVRTLSTDDRMVFCFLLRHDVLNLKMLLKARYFAQEPSALSPCGVTPPDALRRAVNDRQYGTLDPVLRRALDTLEKRLAVKPDPLDIDATLDKALYSAIFKLLPVKQATAGRYFMEKIDLLNGVMTLRALHARKPVSFIGKMLIPGGAVNVRVWEATAAKPEKIPLLMRRYGPRVYAAAIAAQLNAANLAGLERAADDRLLGLYKPFRRAMGRDEVLIGYLLMREREVAAVRLVLAGKANNFPAEAIRERLRELYAG